MLSGCECLFAGPKRKEKQINQINTNKANRKKKEKKRVFLVQTKNESLFINLAQMMFQTTH